MTESHPFNDFDFTQIKLSVTDFDNPIAQIFANYLIFDNKTQGWFLPFPLPTGIGKTHNILVVILECLLYFVKKKVTNSTDDITNVGSGIIFITNAVDNVAEAHKKLFALIDNDNRFTDAQKQYLKQLIIYTPSKTSSLYDVIKNQTLESILEIFNIKDSVLIQQLKEVTLDIQTLEQTDKNSSIYIKYKLTIDKTLENLFDQIFKRITAHQLKSDSLSLTPSQIETVSQLLPAVKLEYQQAYVAFMTTKKFLHGVHQSKGKHHFIDNMANQVLIIDEVDRQNHEILSHLIESTSLDMLTTAKKIQAHLGFATISKRPQYAGIAEKMAEFHQILTKFVIEHHLDKTFDMDTALADKQPRPLLFSDKLAINVTNINSPLYVTYDSHINQNIIFDKDASYDLTASDKFTTMVNRLNKLIATDFGYHVSKLVTLFQHNLEKKQGENNKFLVEMDFALNTILQQFNLRELKEDVLKQIHRMAGKNTAYASHDGTYHTQGISLTDIHRPHDTGDSVIFFHHGFGDSPTGMLAKWVEQGCYIIGISATATNQSVVHNFDMDYLSYRLASQMLSLQITEIEQIKSYYHQQRNYDDYDIQLNYEQLSYNFDELLIILCQLEHPTKWQTINIKKIDVRNMLTARLVEWLDLPIFDDEVYDENHFTFKWLSKVCQAIAQFYTTHRYDNRYMVLMLNRHLSPAVADFLNGYIGYLDNCHGVKTQLFGKVNAQFLKSDKFNQDVRTILSKTKDKVIVFTTYQTFSSGANPDYSFADWELPHLIHVADYAEQGQRTDIDCMYLEKPTHIISGNNNEPLASQLTLLAQGMALQEANQLSNNQASIWANEVIKNAPEQASQKLKERFYNKTHEDYIYACCRDIEQAIGRTNRTGYKRPKIFFWYDDKLVPILSQDKRKNAIVSHEYRHLLAHAQQHPISDRPEIITDKIQNHAHIANIRTQRMINERLYELNQPLDSQDPQAIRYRKGVIAKWAELRIISGGHPNQDSIPTHPNARYYLALPEPDNGYCYAVKRPENKDSEEMPESNYRGEYVFFDKATAESNCHKVSEQDCRLPIMMKNLAIKTFFEQNGIATTWSKKAKYILTPAMYNDIYKGYLGEAGSIAVLQQHDFKVFDLPIEYYEKFDNLLEFEGITAWIDFKNWQQIRWQSSHDELKTEVMTKISDKFRKLQADYQASHNIRMDKLVICNLMANTHDRDLVAYYDDEFNPCPPQYATIMTMTGIIDENTGETNLSAVTALKTWLTI